MRRIVLVLAAVVVGSLSGSPAAADEYGDAVKAFRAAQKSEAWKDRAEAYNEISFFDGPKLVGELLSAMAADPHPGVKLAGLTVLAGLVSDEARDDLLKEAEKGKGARRYLAINAISRQQGDYGKDRLLALLENKDQMVAGQAALALGRKGALDTAPALIELTRSSSWQLRGVAARALQALAGPRPGKVKNPSGELVDDPKKKWLVDGFPKDEVVTALIDLVEKAEGSERGLALQALERITKQEFGWDVPAWRKFAGGTKPEDIKRRPKHPPHLCGMPVYAQRPVVIFDRCLPTDDPHPFGTERLRELCKVPGGPAVLWMPIKTRSQFLRDWTRRFVRSLEKGSHRFEVILAGKQVDAVLGKLDKAGAPAKKKVMTELEELKLQNGLDHLTALEMALNAGGKKDAQAWKKGPDAVIFLACSLPFSVDVTDQDYIAGAIGLMAARRLVPIHSIGVGGHPWSMMRTISAQSGGTYVDLSK